MLPISRRSLLAAAGTAAVIGLAGCSRGDDDDDEDGSPVTSLPPRERSFRVGPDGGGISFEPLIDVGGDHTPEGLAYRDGHIYTGQREGPAWIREYTTEGERTDDRFEFDDVAINHTNTLDWVDDELWVSDSSTNSTYVVDWDEKEVVDEIEHSSPITGTWRAVIPTQTGERKLLFNEWLGQNAWLVDLEGAREDGTTAGNVERDLRNGFWTNPQTIEWNDGYIYMTTHSWVVKSRLPYADQLPEGCPVTSYDVEWAYEFDDGNTLEQVMYNEDDAEFYMIDRGIGGTVYVGTETYGEHRNKSFSRWSTARGSPRGDESINLAEPGTAQLALTDGYGTEKLGWVDVSFYDEGVDETEAGVGVRAENNETYALGVWASVEDGEERYAWHDDEAWRATDVERVPDRWVRFGWEISGSRIDAFVSTNSGRSWEHVGSTTGDDVAVNRLWITRSEGRARVGHWNVELQNVDEY